MPLSPDQAATIARRHNLTLQDAAGLLSLADDVDQADRIAARFAGTDDDTVGREWARALFGRDDTPAEPTDGDGDTPPASDGDTGMRRFAAELFNRP
jgi:hypothetical protein